MKVQLEEMQSRFLQEKDRRRRKERALVKLAKELAKRSKEADNSIKRHVIEGESSLCNEIIRLQLKNKLVEEQISQNSNKMLKVGMAAMVAGVSIGWLFAALKQDETELALFC